MAKNNNITRRNFLRKSVGGVCLAGLGGGTTLLGDKLASRDKLADNLKALGKIDPALIHYKESTQEISTGFTKSRGIAVDFEGTMYIAGGKAIRVFNKSSEFLREIKLGSMPRCVTTTCDGEIYVGMKNHVEIFDTEGRQVASWPSLGDNAFLTSIAVSKDNVFVANAGQRIVIRYDTSGKIINHIGKKDKDRNIPGFVVPSPYFDLAVGSDGLLRVANPGRHRIEAYTFDAYLEFWWGQPSAGIKDFCGCCNPVSFAILDDESFVTCEKGLIRVKVYDPEGAFVSVVAGPEQLAEGRACRICQSPAQCGAGGFDVAVDNKQQVLVLDTIKNVIRTFAKAK